VDGDSKAGPELFDGNTLGTSSSYRLQTMIDISEFEIHATVCVKRGECSGKNTAVGAARAGQEHAGNRALRIRDQSL
jgi:hypothetical protein